MAEPPLTDLDIPAEETRRDRLLRESFVLGFVVLLALVLGMGTLCYIRVERVERQITARGERTREDLETLFELERRASELSAQVITLKTAIGMNSVTFPAAHRVAEARKALDDAMTAGRRTELGKSDEWGRLDRAFNAYVRALDPAGLIPVEPADEFQAALNGLEARVRTNMIDEQEAARDLRKDAQRDIAYTTAACLLVGLVVSGLSFVETRRRIAMIRAAYARVAASKGVIESTLEGMDSAVLTTGLDGVVTRINGAALHVLGYERARDVVGREIEDVLARQPELLAMIAPLVEARNPGRRYLGRVELGRERWLFDVGASPLTIDGEVRGYIVTLSDVTVAERANEELRRNRALVAVGQMTAQVAHEIKNPLGGVRLAAQVLARKLADDPQSLDVIRRIENSVDHLNRTVMELNQFARPKRLELQPVRISELLDEIFPMVADRVEAKAIRVERQYDPATPAGYFDQSELRKAFLNFVINALDASQNGVALEVAVESTGDVEPSVTVTVRDHGEGMDEETLRRLFEPFYTTKAHGTGLGMAIARKIVELHKGRISVSSAVGEGTTVQVTLPLALVPAEVETAAEERG